jgi:hypothetical protein
VPDNLVANLAEFLPIRKKRYSRHRPSRLMRISAAKPNAAQRWNGLSRLAIRAESECNFSVARRPRPGSGHTGVSVQRMRVLVG